MKVIENETSAQYFAYDRCHKIYLLESEDDINGAKAYDYDIIPIDELPHIWTETCPLRFVDSWDLKRVLIPQFCKADFMGWCLDDSVYEEIERMNDEIDEFDEDADDTVYRIVLN